MREGQVGRHRIRDIYSLMVNDGGKHLMVVRNLSLWASKKKITHKQVVKLPGVNTNQVYFPIGFSSCNLQDASLGQFPLWFLCSLGTSFYLYMNGGGG